MYSLIHSPEILSLKIMMANHVLKRDKHMISHMDLLVFWGDIYLGHCTELVP